MAALTFTQTDDAYVATATTETIQVPDIEVSPTDTYTCVISQGAKAISWSSFETELN